MALQNTGVPSVPRSADHRREAFDQWVRNTLVGLQAAILPPAGVSNLRATALAGAIQIDFTRSDGDAYVLYWNSVPSINGATRIDLGTANQYVDQIGDENVTRFYSVKAKKGTVSGAPSPWVSSTSLTFGTPVTPPEPPPATITPFTDQEFDSVAQQYSDKGDYTDI